jgi:hypothetical protein
VKDIEFWVFFVATLALGSRLRQGVARWRAKWETREHSTCSRECKECKGMNPHAPKWTPMLGVGVSKGLLNLQSAISGVKSPCLEEFFISLKRSWSVDVQNGLAWAIWTSTAQVMGKRLPTTKSRESTRFTWLQATCHISLKSFRQGLQLCFRPHRDRRSAEEVIRPQSPGSPCWRDFGTPTRESGERKAIWMPAPWRVTEYTIRGKAVASPSPGRGESCVSVLPVARPSTKGAATMH